MDRLAAEDGGMSNEKAERILKVLLYTLSFWDLAIGLVAIFTPNLVAGLLLDGRNDDLFFVRATGVSQLLAFYIQFLSARRGRKDATALRLSIVFRALFPPLYLSHLFILAADPTPLVAGSLVAFSILDFVVVAVLCRLARCLFGKYIP
jgi:hypothetical protein